MHHTSMLGYNIKLTVGSLQREETGFIQVILVT